MKRFFVPASLCALLCFGLSSFSFGDNLSGPSMLLPERAFDFMEVEEGKIVEHAFKVLNKGNQVLLITHVNPG